MLQMMKNAGMITLKLKIGLTDDAAVSPIFQKAEAKLRNPKLKGIVNHSAGAQFDFKEAYLE